jgi:hypothetical protein
MTIFVPLPIRAKYIPETAGSDSPQRFAWRDKKTTTATRPVAL